ncbi:MAG: 5-formyltetrahydrofolate cyclo-ligase [Gracilimonas sp.]|uniref:5-formyltetrahydrofolate cyclo-ligase n=1 Tax=Gracilimonas sp. TaxID=1974203 RepID=UPI0037531F4A|nr:5-formyltetrahydrofolate cyclo-ligase [Gracilimonas sp.]
MISIRRQKQNLRDTVLKKRKEYTEKDWRSKSEKILGKLLNSDSYKKSNTIHTYVSMNDSREVWTDPLIKQILKDGKQAVVPVVNFSDGTLLHSLIHSLDELESNHWGVREPETKRPIDISEFDLIIIPMAAGDRQCNRLGYGKGFYDRFLKQTTASKIGLTYLDFIFDEIPVEEFDVKLDTIITEEEVILP